jgi:hypothetical protein
MSCIICDDDNDVRYICRKHLLILLDKIKNDVKIIRKPEFMHHCHVCGEYEGRIIVVYEGAYICTKDIYEDCDYYGIKYVKGTQ